MKEIKEILQLLILATILSLVVWLIFFKKPQKVVEYKYRTITTRIPYPYSVPEPYPVPTPPSKVIVYEIDSIALDSLKILLQGQELIIAGLRDSIRINEAFLKQFPRNPKLLSLEVKKDSIKMDLLEISGYPGDWYLPVDFNHYSYRWNLSSGFTRKNVKPTILPPTLKEPFANYFVGGGVDLWHRMPYISARAEKQFSSTRLYIGTQIGLLELDRSNLHVGVEYQLNGKNKP